MSGEISNARSDASPGRLAGAADLPLAFDRLDEIRTRARGKRPAVFLDYDGTLTPIVARPELALLSEQARNTLREVAAKTTIAVISGRDLIDVRRLVAIDGIFYAGSHGFEIEGPGGWRLNSQNADEFLPRLDAAEAELRSRLSAIPGALVERKKFSLATHYRLVAPPDVAAVERAVAETASLYPGLRRAEGKKVHELLPALDWNKGKAVLWLLEALDLKRPDVIPFFIGDDITDEDAFSALRGIGIGILVRDAPRPTAAEYALDSPDQAPDFLLALTSTTLGQAL